MTLEEIFYLVAIVTLISIGAVWIFIAYQVYKLTLILKLYGATVRKVAGGIVTARYSIQAMALKTILNILRGGDSNEE